MLSNMTNSEIIQTAIATENANRQVEAAGHAATLAHLAKQERQDWIDDAVEHAFSLGSVRSIEDRAILGMHWVIDGGEHRASATARARKEWDAWQLEIEQRLRTAEAPAASYLGEDADSDLSVYLVPDKERK